MELASSDSIKVHAPVPHLVYNWNQCAVVLVLVLVELVQTGHILLPGLLSSLLLLLSRLSSLKPENISFSF